MHTINPEVLLFFKALAENNSREWFEPQKPRFKKLESEFKILGEEIKASMNETDEIERAKLFRIYRDVRFSKNKTPFKTHFGMSFNRKKPRLRGGYYIHIAPGDSFLAAGFWNPNKEDLFRIRKEMEMDAEEFRTLLQDPVFTKAWGGTKGDVIISKNAYDNLVNQAQYNCTFADYHISGVSIEAYILNSCHAFDLVVHIFFKT